MDRLKRARRPQRAALTRMSNEMEQDFIQGIVDKDMLRARMEVLEETMLVITELDHKVIDQLLDDDGTEEEQDAELLAIQEYKQRFKVMKQKVERCLGVGRPGSPVPSEAGSIIEQRKRFRLPKIELPKFDGDLKEWLGFWSQFRKIHEDPEIDAADKFQYLTQSMVKGSRAEEVVCSYPQSADNYEKAIGTLKRRFGRETLLVQVYVRELLKLVINNVNKPREKMTISKMYDKLESHLRALESLGVTSEKCDAMLYPLVESSLPEEVLKVWERSSLVGGVTEGGATRSELHCLMEFLRKESESEEKIALARTAFGIFQKELVQESGYRRAKDNKVPTAAGLFAGQVSKCIFCEKSHDSKDCFRAQSMTLEEKRNRLRNRKACFLCFQSGHIMRACKMPMKCFICARKHQVLMCPEAHKQPTVSNEVDQGEMKVNSTHSNLNCTSDILLQTLIVGIWNQKGDYIKKIRALCDPGSQRSYILQRTADTLGLERSSEVKLCHLLFGGAQDVQEHGQYTIRVCNTSEGANQELKVLGHKRICGTIPRLHKGSWRSELTEHGIQVEDLGKGNPEIELLIGSDYYAKILTGRKYVLSNGLVALETSLGWTLSGKQDRESPESSFAMSVTSMLVTEASLAELWSLESIGIRDPIECKTREEREECVRQHFRETVTRDDDGRYAVNLPWIDGHRGLPSNRSIAEKRLVTTIHKLRTLGKLEEYQEVFCAWIKEGIIEEVIPDDLAEDQVHYLPHRAVFKPLSKTTPVRPVFDASSKAFRSPSLNDCLEKGPNLVELLPTLLLRFREKSVGVVADIRKAFQMISVKQEDRDFLRFLWRDEVTGSYQVYRHKRVVFGVNCSPFLLAAVIELHLQGIKGEEEPTAAKLLESLYVDNCVTSVDNLEEYEVFKAEATRIMDNAKMELRQWECTDVEASVYCNSWGESEQKDSPSENEVSCTAVLGLKWDKCSDTLSCEPSLEDLPFKISKRGILSSVQRVFDPIGFTCPAMLLPKLMLQSTWERNIGWDSELPEELQTKFKKWLHELPFLEQIRIPRNITCGKNDRSFWQLHVFCDASKEAYAAVVFLRTVDGLNTTVQLLQAKTRVAPLKKATIPRLELLACTIAARLAATVKKALDLKSIQTFYWSDSTTALAWIKGNHVWGTFVGNRVKEICQLTDACDWRYVPGEANPSDLPSRGCTPRQLLVSRWWEGPDWLKLSPEQWPTDIGEVDEGAVFNERKRSVATIMINHEGSAPWYENRFSSYTSALKTVAWMRRFIRNARGENPRTGGLTAEEICQAEKAFLRTIQYELFPTQSEFIAGIQVKRCKDSLLRVETRLLFKDDTTSFREPILLPNRHSVVDLIIQETHVKHGHAGVQFLMGRLRERFWIIQGRRDIRRVLNKCVRCLRFTAKKVNVDPSPLPPERVNAGYVFQTTGVDLAGPLFLKKGGKAWVVLFTCAVYRCVHIDYVTSLSTQAFLGALNRFIRRRGRPMVIYSDHGTNFTGTQHALKAINWTVIQESVLVERIQWRFNPPTAAWWGGWWERLIRSVKDLLKRMLGNSRVNLEELRTCLADVEGVINDRPLTTVTEDADDLIPLTPAMFIRGAPSADFPEYQLLGPPSLQDEYQKRKTLHGELQLRFRREYLSLLVQRSREKGSPKP